MTVMRSNQIKTNYFTIQFLNHYIKLKGGDDMANTKKD